MIILDKNLNGILHKPIPPNHARRSIPDHQPRLPILNDLILRKNNLVIIDEQYSIILILLNDVLLETTN
jgi:hypothetical protein